MTDLYYPTVDLFLYDLIEALNDTSQTIVENKGNFSLKLPSAFRDKLQYPSVLENHEFTHLFSNEVDGTKSFKAKRSQYALEGYYYPVGLGDTYGLLLDCSSEQQMTAQPLDILKEIKAEIDGRLNGERATLGETWLISAWLDETSVENAEKIAQECYQVLMPHLNWQSDFDGKGTFLGASIFELSSLQFENYYHVIIILYPDAHSMLTLGNEFMNSWLRLFCYHHKIVWAYTQSRDLTQKIKKGFQGFKFINKSIRQKSYEVNNLTTLRSSLEQAQRSLDAYEDYLPELKSQNMTMETNLENYIKRVEQMSKNAKSISPKLMDLQFLMNFSQLTKNKYLLQNQKDGEYFELGLRIFEDRINTVQSQLEVEKAERERNFQRLVTIIGAGTAVTSLLDYEGKKCSAFIRLFPHNSHPSLLLNKTNKELICHPFFAFFFPMFSILFIGLLALGLKRYLLENKFIRRRLG